MASRVLASFAFLLGCVATQIPTQPSHAFLSAGATTDNIDASSANGMPASVVSKNSTLQDVSRATGVTESSTTQYIAKVLLLGAAYGFVFGMMGAGGSLILKPLLYFGFDLTPFRHAVFNSFLVLIVLAGYGASLGQLKGKVVWRDVAILATCVSGFGCVVGALLASMVSDATQLHFFAVLILCVAVYMLMPKKQGDAKKGDTDVQSKTGLFSQTVAMGLVIGMLSGFAGVGGGFMLVPLLTHMGHDMDTAVPTSQAVICLSSIAGFFWYAYFNSFGMQELRLTLSLSLMTVAMCGLYFSDVISRALAQPTRQRIFACLLISIFALITANPVSSA